MIRFTTRPGTTILYIHIACAQVTSWVIGVNSVENHAEFFPIEVDINELEKR